MGRKDAIIMAEHDHFIEMCAGYALGTLSSDQAQELKGHLTQCAECREAVEQFQQITSMGMPAIAPDFAQDLENTAASSTTERIEHRLFARIENEMSARTPKGVLEVQGSGEESRSQQNRILLRTSVAWTVAAAALVMIALAVTYSYRLGTEKGVQAAEPKFQQAQSIKRALEYQLDQIQIEHKGLAAKLMENDRVIQRLNEELRVRTEEGVLLKAKQQALGQTLQGAEAKAAAADADRGAMVQKLSDAQATLQSVQQRLNSTLGERVGYLQRVTLLERRLEDVSGELKDKTKTIQEQSDMLAYDRDIRDLIGARDLYVAEVNDVGRDAQTQKPFGRVFFTKGKSLIFYAYDLDDQAGLRRASIFQAWGRRGADFSEALPLGIMYLDSSAKRRWVLRFDNPQELAKIDAVFVTVEPKGGSHMPTSRPLLFAYLKVEPNHP